MVKRLASEFSGRAVPEGGMLSAVDIAGGADAGDLELLVTATFLPDLPTLDFSSLKLERLLAEDTTMAHAHLKRQVLDHLERVYAFPIAPILIEREFATIVQAAEAELDLNNENRAQLEAEFRPIAERRIRLGMVVAETARRNDIRVSDAEVAKIRESMTEEARAAETEDQTRRRALEEKVMGWIVSRACVTDRSVSMDELEGL